MHGLRPAHELPYRDQQQPTETSIGRKEKHHEPSPGAPTSTPVPHLPSSLIHTVPAVSYTHLDVYKRQPITSVRIHIDTL